VLNGPSLVSGDYDLSKLNSPGVITYGVNNGPSTFRPTFWSCVDDPGRFLKSIWLDPRITKFVPHAHAEKPIFDNETWNEMREDGRRVLVGECPNCVFFHRNEKFVANRWLFEDKINWGNHKDYGGCRTVMLPALRILFLLGFRKVYLLGADFTMTEEYAYHFDEKREKGAVNCNMKTYKRMRDEYFPKLKPFFKEEGFEVYNCNPDSGLKDTFDFISFDDAISECTGKLGNVPNERTWGMYCKPGDKEKTKDEPAEHKKKHLSNLQNRKSVLKETNRVELENNKLTAKEKIHTEEELKALNPVIQEPSVKTVKLPEPEENVPEIKKPYTIQSVENAPTENVISVNSSGGVVKAERVVKAEPKVEKIEEVPATPIPQVVPGERKLIRHLPFRG
jgi:hypothetical protein